MANPNFDPSVGQSTQFGQPGGNDPKNGGRPKIKPLRKLLQELEDRNFEIRIPIENCTVNKDEVIISLPSREALAVTLTQNAILDVAWMRELLKVLGDYAPTKVAETDTEGNDRKIDNKPIVMQYDDMVKEAMERIKKEQTHQ